MLLACSRAQERGATHHHHSEKLRWTRHAARWRGADCSSRCRVSGWQREHTRAGHQRAGHRSARQLRSDTRSPHRDCTRQSAAQVAMTSKTFYNQNGDLGVRHASREASAPRKTDIGSVRQMTGGLPPGRDAFSTSCLGFRQDLRLTGQYLGYKEVAGAILTSFASTITSLSSPQIPFDHLFSFSRPVVTNPLASLAIPHEHVPSFRCFFSAPS